MLVGISGKKQSGKNTVAKIWQLLSTYHKCSETSAMRQKYPVDIQWIQHVIDSDINNDSEWIQKSYAHKLKQIVSLLIGCTMEQLEDNTFKETPLGEEWDCFEETSSYGASPRLMMKHNGAFHCYKRQLTPRLLLQLLGTQCGREILHPQIWVNALFADYKLSFNEESQSNPYDPRSKTGGLEYPNWLVTDCRFPNEVSVILDKEGIAIRVDREIQMSDFKEGFKYQMKSGFSDGTVKTHNDYYKAEWEDCVFTEGDRPYINRMFTGRNYTEKGLLGLRFMQDSHLSETALDDYESFDYYIKNNGSIEDLIKKVKDIMIEEGVIEGVLG